MTKDDFRNAVVEGIKRVKGLDAVAIAEEVARRLRAGGHRVGVVHRDVDK